MSSTPHAADAAASTGWQEIVRADEAERFAKFATQFAEIQQRKSAKYGKGRALHRKQIVAARAEFSVHGNLPEFARHGIFAKPASYPCRLRLSNGAMDAASDKKPDIRGFAISVGGIAPLQGPSALGNGTAQRQDFLLINHEAFAFAGSDDFAAFVVAASHGGGALIKFLISRFGLVGAIRQMGQMAKTFGKPFDGFAASAMFSAAPIACGPYAVRVKLQPHVSNGTAAQAPESWNEDFGQRIAQRALGWDIQLQPFADEASTPIENASVNWPTPYVTVATLSAANQDVNADPVFAKEVEQAVFDPWQALAAHRPLGEVMRARKVVYFESQKGRGAA